jgi:hypothetical protein
MRLAVSRPACTAGNNNETSTPTIVITNNNSINVNAERGEPFAVIAATDGS